MLKNFKMVSFPFPLLVAWEDFSNIHCEGLTLTNVWGPPMTRSPWKFYLSGLSTFYLSGFSNSAITVQGFLPWCWFPWRLWLMGFWFSRLRLFVSICLSLQFWDRQFVLWSHFSKEYKRSYWFYSLLIFVFVIRMEWQLLSSLHVGLETTKKRFQHILSCKGSTGSLPCYKLVHPL